MYHSMLKWPPIPPIYASISSVVPQAETGPVLQITGPVTK